MHWPLVKGWFLGLLTLFSGLEDNRLLRFLADPDTILEYHPPHLIKASPVTPPTHTVNCKCQLISEQDQLSYIKISVVGGKSLEQIITELTSACHNSALSVARITKEYNKLFLGEGTSADTCVAHNDPPLHCEVTLEENQNLAMLESLMTESREWTYNELLDILHVDSTELDMLLEKANYKLVDASWVPRELTEMQKASKYL